MLNSVSSSPPKTALRRPTTIQAGGGVQAAGKQSVLDKYIPASAGDMINTGSMLGRVGNAANTAVKGGQEALPNVQAGFNALKGFDISGLWTAGKALGKTAMTWGTKSAMVQGAVSLVANGYRAIKGRESWGDAGTNVVVDTASGAVGGAAGAVAGAIGTMALTALGVAGGPLTLGAALIGMGGYFLGERMFKSTSIFHKFKSTVSTIMHDAFRPFNA